MIKNIYNSKGEICTAKEWLKDNIGKSFNAHWVNPLSGVSAINIKRENLNGIIEDAKRHLLIIETALAISTSIRRTSTDFGDITINIHGMVDISNEVVGSTKKEIFADIVDMFNRQIEELTEINERSSATTYESLS